METLHIEERVKKLLLLVGQQGASDLHLVVGRYPTLRIDGKLHPILQEKMLLPADTKAISDVLLTDEKKEELLAFGQTDFSYNFEDRIRFRTNEKLAHLHDAFERRLIGQEEASLALEETLARSVSNIGDPERPLGSFLFLGPTGVGKTYIAKLLAEEFFGSKKALVRLNMSEFMERHSVAQILGAPAGYVGHGEGGKLTETIRRKPYSVVLFDEIEKAHPDVWNILLQILDEGTLTDAEGRSVSFKNTLIILTSNIGTAAFTQSARIGFEKHLDEKSMNERFEAIKRNVLQELKKEMRPELLARLDQVVVFKPLTEEAMEHIVQLELEELTKRLKTKDLLFTFNKAVVHFIAKKSFAPEQGARLIRKNIQDLVEKPLAKKILSPLKKKTIRLSVAKKGGTLVCS